MLSNPMISKTMTKSRVFILAIVSVLFVTTSESCGPDFPALTFTRSHGPDGPINVFSRGKIGIPLPTWWRAYLVVAYRYLENKPLSRAESASFAGFWGTEQIVSPSTDSVDDAIDQWIKTRANILETRAKSCRNGCKARTQFLKTAAAKNLFYLQHCQNRPIHFFGLTALIKRLPCTFTTATIRMPWPALPQSAMMQLPPGK